MNTNDFNKLAQQQILAIAIPEAVWDTNLLTGETFVNEALLSIFGYTETAVKDNESWWKTNLHPDDRERVVQGMNEALMSDKVSRWTDVYQFRCSNGIYKTIADRSTIIRDELGKPIRLVGTMLDITEREEREKKLQEALRRYNVLMQATQDAIWDMHLITKETYTNDTLREIFGYQDEVEDNDLWWNSNLHPEDRERVVSGINEALDSGKEIWKDEYRFRCKNGNYKIVYDRSTIVRNEQGKPVRLIGAMQDVTSERILQQALTTQAIVKHRRAARGIMQVQEKEKQLLGDALHENISQMLATIKLFIDHALENETERENFLKESSGYLNVVINEIRRLHRDLVPPPLETFSLEFLLQQQAEEMLTGHGIETVVDAGQEDNLDKEMKLMLYRIAKEQLDNVLCHSEATLVTVKLRQTEDSIVVIIADNGKGINMASFDEGAGFKRIRNMVEVYNGTCEVKAFEGNGFALTVSIPLEDFASISGGSIQKIPAAIAP